MSFVLGGYPLSANKGLWGGIASPDREPSFFDRELNIMRSCGRLYVLISLVEGVASYEVEAHLRNSLQGVDIPNCPDKLRVIVAEALGSFKPSSPDMNRVLVKYGIESPVGDIDEIKFTLEATG